MYKVIDNFLPKEDFIKIKNVIGESPDFPWYYSPDINKYEESNKCYFTHILFSGVTLEKSTYFNVIKPLVQKIDPLALIRIKCNLYPSTKELETHAAHTDYPYKHKGAIFCVNSCNGGTIMADDTTVDAVENRIFFFDPSLPHSSTTTTNLKARININFNYF